MGNRRRAAAERLAQAIGHGEGPTDLRSLLVHGPMASPSFEQAGTLRLERVEIAIAPEPSALEPADALDDVEPATVRTEVVATPIAEAAVELPGVPARRRAFALAAAGLALALGGLAAAAIAPNLQPVPAGSTLGAALASLPRADAFELVDGVPDPPQLDPAPTDPLTDDAGEAIVVLDEAASPRIRKRSRSRRTKRSAPPVQAGGLVVEAASALEAGARDDAIDLYEQALTANPRSGAAAAGLSTAYFDLGRFDLATAWAEHAVKADFRNPEYHVLLGDAYYRNASLEDARVQWKTAAKLGSSRARHRLAKLQ